MPRLLEMNRYWRKHPPVHFLLAAYLGYDPERAEQKKLEERTELIGLIAAVGGEVNIRERR